MPSSRISGAATEAPWRPSTGRAAAVLSSFRAAGRATVDALLADAKRGRVGSLVLTGQAGIGKSALVQNAIDVASESRVVRIAGVESELAYRYAGVHQVVLPILDLTSSSPRRNGRRWTPQSDGCSPTPPTRSLSAWRS